VTCSGRIYEYNLAEFSKQGAHDNGEFFTPSSKAACSERLEPALERRLGA